AFGGLAAVSNFINPGARDKYRKIAIAVLALSFGAGLLLIPPPASAQEQKHEKAQGQPRGGNAGVPRGAGRNVTPNVSRTVTPRAARTVSPRTVTTQTNRTVAPRTLRTVTPRMERTVTPSRLHAATPRDVVPRPAAKTFAPSAGNARVVNAGRLRGVPVRGAGRATIAGRNYSAWRGGYRVRHGGGWRTFVAIGSLGVLAFGASSYYPYAYIS